MGNSISIEVVYGTPQRQKILNISVPPETTVESAIELSGMQRYFPDMIVEKDRVGIWNRSCKLTDIVKQHDRIEIYRPLIADPKENRRRRAELAKKEGRADQTTGGRPDPDRGIKS
ncbi:MAG TPA: RnfH family protein [Aliidiomarina sp.]|nr:RnfH family protein [Aliidiomarina sp.]